MNYVYLSLSTEESLGIISPCVLVLKSHACVFSEFIFCQLDTGLCAYDVLSVIPVPCNLTLNFPVAVVNTLNTKTHTSKEMAEFSFKNQAWELAADPRISAGKEKCPPQNIKRSAQIRM